MRIKPSIFCMIMACAITSCAKSDAPRANATEVTEIALADVPTAVNKVVAADSPNFKATEVLKKVRDGRVYYDVEGELPGGEEIEFDVLMTKNGPEIVEIQRDLKLGTVPQEVRNVVKTANTDKLKIVRVIESRQSDGVTTIYEVFVADAPSSPRFEVSVSGNSPAKLLETRWKH